MSKKISFVGLGVMGYPMAGHLSASGYEVAVYNRTRSKAEQWVEAHGGRLCETPAEAAEGADLIMVCVGDDNDLRSVILGEHGVFSRMREGAIVVDHTTASAQVARELYLKAEEFGVEFLDAPISGGQSGAENGTLSVMVGGDPEPYAIAEPVMACYARAVRHIGPSGAGQLAKMVNQICIAGVLQGLAEGLHFANAAGLDAHTVVDVVSKGAAQSWQMDNRYDTMLAGRFDFGFAVDWMRKDLGMVLEEARRNGCTLPLTALVDQFYGDVQKLGGGRWDTSSLITRFEPPSEKDEVA